MNRELTKGCFYWVRMVIGDERNNVIPETVWAPARYTGRSADTRAREEARGDKIVLVSYSPDTWDFIGFRSDDGHHFVDVMDVGPEIVFVFPHPESDMEYRLRLIGIMGRMNDLDRFVVPTVTGVGLDVIGNHYDMPRQRTSL